MKCSVLLMLLIATFSSCHQVSDTKTGSEVNSEKTKLKDPLKDKEEIEQLIRQALKWADSKNAIELIPAISDNRDSLYTGFDFKVIKSNTEKLQQSGFFSQEFIDNYLMLMTSLDKGIKNKVYSPWLVGDLQTFNFANDFNPWCYCQELPYDNPNPWTLTEIKIIKLNEERGELTWTWGQTDWPDIAYNFKVVKENGKWKIAYMKGFDYNESIKKE